MMLNPSCDVYFKSAIKYGHRCQPLSSRAAVIISTAVLARNPKFPFLSCPKFR